MTHQYMELKIKELEKRIESLEQEPFINKPCISGEVCEHDKNKVLDKIRAKIQAMSTDYCGGYIGLDKQEVLKIIDKYTKGEGE